MSVASDSSQQSGWAFGSGAHGTRLEIPQPGTRFGTFEIQGTLGQGGMGVVLAARDSMGREVALKLLSHGRPSDKAVQRFQREGEVMASLRHSGIVTVHEAGEVNGCPFLSCGRVEGGDLATLLEQGADRETLLGLVQEIAEAVGYAHEHGVVHRDLKPANVLIDGRGHARVADFGLAQAVGLERLTLSGALVGTPGYMAPEQITAQREGYGPHTDTWALGVLLYRVLTGVDPFQAGSLAELSATILKRDPTAPRSLDSTISAGLEAVCRKALRKAPEARYADGQGFSEDLARARRGERPHALSEGRRVRLLTFLGGLVGVVLLVVGGGLLATNRGDAGPHPEAGTPQSSATPKGGGTVVAEKTPAEVLLQRRLGRALTQVEQGERAGVAEIARLAGELRLSERLRVDVREAQGALTAKLGADLETARPLQQLLPTVEGLAALHDALPGGEPPFTNSTELSNGVVWVCAREQDNPPLVVETLEALARCEVRCYDPVVAGKLLERVAMPLLLLKEVDRDAIPLGTRLFVAAAKLDLGLGERRGKDTTMWRAFRPSGDGPWLTYARLRLSADERESLVALFRLLREPPPGLDLGPVHWAETARLVAPLVEAREEKLELLREALQHDPRNWLVRLDLSVALRDSLRYGEAFEECERARELFLEQGYDQGSKDWWLILVRRVECLARDGQRVRAQAAYREFTETFPRRTKQGDLLLSQHPWLEDE